MQLEIVNSLSPQGQLPLGLALLGRSTQIAQTLVQTGKADVNAYNGDVSMDHSIAIPRFLIVSNQHSLQGCTLLVDAVRRGDGFSAQFLLDHGCNVNLSDRGSADTALHLVSTYAEKSTDGTSYTEMLSVAKCLLDTHKADTNLRNQKG